MTTKEAPGVEASKNEGESMKPTQEAEGRTAATRVTLSAAVSAALEDQWYGYSDGPQPE